MEPSFISEPITHGTRAWNLIMEGVEGRGLTHSYTPAPAEKKQKTRYPRSVAAPVLKSLQGILERCDRYEICGSYRRGKDTIADLDVVVMTNDFQKTVAQSGFLWSGSEKASFVVNGLQVDFRKAEPENWVTMVAYFTGSREENIRLRSIARDMGMKLNEYGLWKDGERVPCESEEDIYKNLGIKYRKPSER